MKFIHVADEPVLPISFPSPSLSLSAYRFLYRKRSRRRRRRRATKREGEQQAGRQTGPGSGEEGNAFGGTVEREASFPGEAIGSRIERRVSERFRKGRSKRRGWVGG